MYKLLIFFFLHMSRRRLSALSAVVAGLFAGLFAGREAGREAEPI